MIWGLKFYSLINFNLLKIDLLTNLINRQNKLNANHYTIASIKQIIPTTKSKFNFCFIIYFTTGQDGIGFFLSNNANNIKC